MLCGLGVLCAGVAWVSPIEYALGRPEMPCANPDIEQLKVTGTRPIRVLLAEDTLVNQKAVSGILQRHGHSVMIAANGRLAVEELARNQIMMWF